MFRNIALNLKFIGLKISREQSDSVSILSIYAYVRHYKIGGYILWVPCRAGCQLLSRVKYMGALLAITDPTNLINHIYEKNMISMIFNNWEILGKQ